MLLFCSGGFAALTLAAAAGYYLAGEPALLKWIVGNRIPALNPVAQTLSLVGSMNFILPFWLVLVVVLLFKREPRPLLQLLPVPVAYPIYVLVKNVVARPGPTQPTFPWLYDFPLGYHLEGLFRRQLQQLPPQGVAVPLVQQPVTAKAVTQVIESGYISGHAFVALVFYGTLAWYLWRHAHPRAAIAALGLGLLVGLVRIYMGVHFPSDVLGAWLLAPVFLIAADALAKVAAPLYSAWRLALGRRRDARV